MHIAPHACRKRSFHHPLTGQGRSVTRSGGYTLVELALVLAVAGLLLLIAMPQVSLLRTRGELRGARTRVAALIQQSRLRAIHESRSVTIRFSDSTVHVTGTPRRTAGAAPCRCDTLMGDQNLRRQFGVSLSVSPDTLRLDPRGLSPLTGNDGLTLILVLSDYADTLRVDPLGNLGT